MILWAVAIVAAVAGTVAICEWLDRKPGDD